MTSSIAIPSIFELKYIAIQNELFRFPLPNQQAIGTFKTNTNIHANANINETMPYFNKALPFIDFKSTKYDITLINKNKKINKSVNTCSPLQKYARVITSKTYVSNAMANALLTSPAYKPQCVKKSDKLILPHTFLLMII